MLVFSSEPGVFDELRDLGLLDLSQKTRDRLANLTGGNHYSTDAEAQPS